MNSADGAGTPRSPLNLRSISLVERAQSNSDSQGDEQGAASGLMTRQMSVRSAVQLYCFIKNRFYAHNVMKLLIVWPMIFLSAGIETGIDITKNLL